MNLDGNKPDAKKPSEEFFQGYLDNYYNPSAKGKTILFIDDKQENGDAFAQVAQRNNVKLKFIRHDKHNVKATEDELKKLGLLSAKSDQQ